MAPQRLFSGHILVNPVHRVLYLAIPKCANSSLKSAFIDNLDVPVPSELIAAIPPERLAFSPLQDAAVKDWMAQRQRLVDRNAVLPGYADYRRIAVLRDPLARVRSCWKDKIAPEPVTDSRFVEGRTKGFLKFGDLFYAGMSFESFLEAVAQVPDSEANPHFRSQADFLHDDAGNRLAETFFFVETLNAGIAAADPEIRACFAGLGQKNIKSGGSPAPEISGKARAILRGRYAKDYAMLASLGTPLPFDLT
nr:sulfotransferase family 2 domain-containing protein [Sagittula salina]